MLEEDESVFAAMLAGARGYLLKGSGRDEVLRAVRTVAAGEAIFGPAIAERFTSYFAAAAEGAPRPFPELTVARARNTRAHGSRRRQRRDRV